MRPYRIGVLGGTFDGLHPGHRRLLSAAFRRAEEVRIGLTTAGYLRDHPKPWGEAIAPYRERRAKLMEYLQEHFPRRRYRILPLRDGYGGSVLPGPDLLVVSTESLRGARAVNRERRRRGLALLTLHVIPTVRDRTGRPYSSRRRRARESPRRRPRAGNV